MRQIVQITCDEAHWEPVVVPFDCHGYATLAAESDFRFRLDQALPGTEYLIPALAQDTETMTWTRTGAGGAGGPDRHFRYLAGDVIGYVRVLSGVAVFRIKFVR